MSIKTKFSTYIHNLRNYKDTNGIRRNIGKLVDEFINMQESVKKHDRRWEEDKDSHAWVNLFVERNRASPYFMGHVDAVIYPLCLILILIKLF